MIKTGKAKTEKLFTSHNPIILSKRIKRIAIHHKKDLKNLEELFNNYKSSRTKGIIKKIDLDLREYLEQINILRRISHTLHLYCFIIQEQYIKKIGVFNNNVIEVIGFKKELENKEINENIRNNIIIQLSQYEDLNNKIKNFENILKDNLSKEKKVMRHELEERAGITESRIIRINKILKDIKIEDKDLIKKIKIEDKEDKKLHKHLRTIKKILTKIKKKQYKALNQAAQHLPNYIKRNKELLINEINKDKEIIEEINKILKLSFQLYTLINDEYKENVENIILNSNNEFTLNKDTLLVKSIKKRLEYAKEISKKLEEDRNLDYALSKIEYKKV